MVEPSAESEKNIEKPENSPSPRSRPSFSGDLERALARRASATSPALSRQFASSPIANHRPASVTSLPVQGIQDAPTHGRRRRRNNRQRQVQVPEGPRRANSLPVNAISLDPTTLADHWKTLVQPTKKLVGAPTLYQCFINTLKYSWLNVMILFLPVAWAAHYSHLKGTIVFVFSFLSIIPLAALLGFATEELAIRLGDTLGSLLNATLGNSVELIIAILALTKGQLKVVQAAMLGSILSNCLLVLGMCFLAGGLRFHEQGYGVRIAQQQISLLSLCVFSISIPAAFTTSVAKLEEKDILAISRATSIVLLVSYFAFLVFQLWTHSYLYSAEASKHHAAATFLPHTEGNPAPPIGQSVFRVSSVFAHGSTTSSSSSSNSSTAGEAEEEVPKLTVKYAFALLLVVTVLTGLTAEFLVDSIGELTETTSVSREFVALILLPLVGNAAEHVTAVTVSIRNKLDLAMGVAIGSSLQIALFVLPFLVVLGWWIDQPLSLNFDTFESIVVVLTAIAVNFAIADGRSNWLEGYILMVIYVLIGVAAWYYNSVGDV